MVQDISRGTESALEELGHMDKTVKCVGEAVLDINRAGQEIHAHLAWEPELGAARQQILGQHTDKADIERAVQVFRPLLRASAVGTCSSSWCCLRSGRKICMRCFLFRTRSTN